MKAKKSMIIFLSIICIAFFSCKKDSPKPAEPISTMVGTWVGESVFIGYEPSFISFVIKDHTLLVVNKDGNTLGNGNWKLDGTAFTAKIIYNPPFNATYTYTASFNGTNKLASGAYINDDDAGNTGTWEMTKTP